MRSRALVVAAVAALIPWHAEAQDAGMADMDDFALETGEDLADLCGVTENDPLYADATMFCLGVIEGMVQYHDAIGKGPEGDLVVCPEGAVTRSATVEVFVDWAAANPQRAAALWPAEAVVEAALAEWGPCGQ